MIETQAHTKRFSVVFLLQSLMIGLVLAALQASPAAANAPQAGLQSDLPPESDNSQSAYTMIGEAFDVETMQLLYREYHQRDEARDKHAVSYRKVNGEAFVEKIIDTSRRAIAPDFHQQDYRNGTVISAVTRNNRVTLLRGVAPPTNPRAMLDAGAPQDLAVESKHQLAATPQLVIDAGFDYFVRQRWEALVAGEVLSFDFVVPARGRTVAMSIAKVERERCAKALVPQRTVAGLLGEEVEHTCFRLAVNNWLARAFVKPIYLVYEQQSKRLMAFQGLSNLKNDAGKAQTVLITYRYL